MACRSGCATKDHSSWAECARSANVAISATTTSRNYSGWNQTKADLKAYKQARADGIQPEGTTMDKIVAAKQATKNLGRPYDANIDPPAKLIVNKKTGDFVNRKVD